MRLPAFLTLWLITFAIAASAAALGGALLLDRELRRERAGAAARGEMDAFVEGKLARKAEGKEAVKVMKGLAAGTKGHEGAAFDVTAEVARFRAASDPGERNGRIFLYRSGAKVEGSRHGWPKPLRPFDNGLYSFRLPDGGEAVAAVHRLANGDQLLVGRRVERVDPLSGRVLRTSGLTLLGLALAGAAIGWLFSIGYDRRLREITDACERVEAGEMAARAPEGDRPDEFGLLARRVNRMLDRVGRYVAGMRDVSDEIAHDLRTPLNRIQARLLAARSRLDAEGGKDLDLAAEDVRHLAKVIDDFLWLREIEAGQGGETSFFDLKTLIEQTAEDHALIAQETKDVDVAVEGLPVEAMGVRSLIIRAVDNLIGNAVKFTPPGSVIRVSTARGPDTVEVLVEDNGPGMPPELLARAIQPGVRGAHEAAGHGLGLAIAAAVARRHGGDLTLQNRTDGGLRVRLSLPAPHA